MSDNSYQPVPPTLADPDTGELWDLQAVPRRAKYNGGPWLMVMQQMSQEVAYSQELKPVDYQILWVLVGILKWDNHLMLNVSQLARDLGKSRPTVSNSIRRLIDAGLLVRGPRNGSVVTYRLSPDLGWKGSHKGRSALQNEMDRRGWAVHDGGSPEEPQSTEPSEEGQQ